MPSLPFEEEISERVAFVREDTSYFNGLKQCGDAPNNVPSSPLTYNVTSGRLITSPNPGRQHSEVERQ